MQTWVAYMLARMPGNAPRRPRVVPVWGVVLALCLALVAVTASTSFLMRPPQTVQQLAVSTVPTVSPSEPPAQARGLHIYLLPHPDDELSAWTSLVDGDDLYPVLVLLTRGEATQRCATASLAKHLNAARGEIPPTPDPGTDTASMATCQEARLNSFRQAVSEAADHTPVVALDWTDTRTVELDGQAAEVVSGPSAALVVLDLGDGTLTADRVESAVRTLLEESSSWMPDLPLVRVTSSAYYATQAATESAECDDTACLDGGQAYVYDHPDHAAVWEAARSLAPLTEQGSWVVTQPNDSAADRHLALPEEMYQQFMELGPGDPWTAERRGTYQRIYGWLAFPDVWRPGDLPTQDAQVLFPRVQSFEIVTP